MTMTPAEMESLLVSLCRFQIEAADLAREMAPARTLEAAHYEQACAEAALSTLRQAVLLRDRDIARGPLQATAQRLGIELDLSDGDGDYQRLAMRALEAMIEAGEENMRRDKGQFGTGGRYLPAARPVAEPVQGAILHTAHDRPSPVETRQTDVSAGLKMIGITPENPMAEEACRQLAGIHETGNGEASNDAGAPEEPISALTRPSRQTETAPRPAAVASKQKPRMSRSARELRRIGEEYVALRCKGHATFKRTEIPNAKTGKSWERNSAPNVRSTINLLEKGLGGKDLADLTDKMLTEFWSIVVRLPRGYGDRTDDKRSLREIADEADRQDAKNEALTRARHKTLGSSPGKTEFDVHISRLPRLRVGTIYRHMQDAQRIMKFAVAKGYLASNIMSDHIWDSRELARREMMQEDNKRETWSQKLPILLRSRIFQQELEDPGDPMFWAPLIALHAGLRSEEILQLATDDIREVEGIPCFVLQQGLGQSLKSAAPRRIVPVHRNLIDLGLLELVALRKREAEPRLFPWLERSGAKETFTEPFSKEFTRYRKEIKVYQRGLDFHAFRTTFNQALISTECLDSQRRYMLGHVENDTGIKHYAPEGFPIERLRERVDAVVYDVSMMRRPFESLGLRGVSDLDAHRQAKAARTS
ncbi:hypothetical protein KUV73_10680 [Mameliella alba]|nr:hypothetical protein [Mameliella alba]MBY6174828.1 hypothetical protein [Mameliella alba]